MERKQNNILIKDQLAAAGIRKTDIDLATETSEILLIYWLGILSTSCQIIGRKNR